MRRFWALMRSAALQTLAEPLSSVLFLVAFLAVYVAPVFHFHAFGDAGRLARETGLSALLVFGVLFSTAAAVRAIGGEIVTGTAAVALSRPISRPLFFCARVAGVVAAFALFGIGIAAATLLSVQNCETGAVLLARGEEARIWPLGLLLGVVFTLGGLVLAAAADRFRRARFCVSACLLLVAAQVLALATALGCGPLQTWNWIVLVPLALLGAGLSVFVALAGALSVFCRPAWVVAGVAFAVVCAFGAGFLETVSPTAACLLRSVVPDMTRFWLVEHLDAGLAGLPVTLTPTALSSVVLLAFWLVLGSLFLCRREIP